MDKYTFSKVPARGPRVVAEAYVSGERVPAKIKQPQMSWTACLNMRELRYRARQHQNIVALKELILHRSVLHFVRILPEIQHGTCAASQPAAFRTPTRLMASGILSMAHAHAGLMHRDLKPENILCDVAVKTPRSRTSACA